MVLVFYYCHFFSTYKKINNVFHSSVSLILKYIFVLKMTHQRCSGQTNRSSGRCWNWEKLKYFRKIAWTHAQSLYEDCLQGYSGESKQNISLWQKTKTFCKNICIFPLKQLNDKFTWRITLYRDPNLENT